MKNDDQQARSLPSRTALIAEDDELIREIVATYLKRLGYEVIEAADGQKAIEIIEGLDDRNLNLIVTDLLMPKLGGEQVVASAKSHHICDRFLVMSGFSEHMPRRPDCDDDNTDYLEKPFTFSAFKEKVASLA